MYGPTAERNFCRLSRCISTSASRKRWARAGSPASSMQKVVHPETETGPISIRLPPKEPDDGAVGGRAQRFGARGQLRQPLVVEADGRGRRAQAWPT